MLTDLSIAAAKKLARGKEPDSMDFALILAKVDLVGQRFSYLAETRLADTEKRKLANLGSGKRRREWLAGRIAAKEAIFRMLEVERGGSPSFRDFRSMVIEQTEKGAPYLASGPWGEKQAAGISISHSDGLAAALADKRVCGIDIQKIDAALDRIQGYFVSDGERKMLGGRGSQAYSPRQRLALLWSAKEAVKKQCGRRTMPGFKDLELTSVNWSDPLLLTISCPRDNSGGKRFFSEVAAFLYGSYSLAWTIRYFYCSKTNS